MKPRKPNMDVLNKIQAIIAQIIKNRRDVIELACSRRSKFEHWLKFELAAVLAQMYGASNILIEPPYPSGCKADLSFQAKNTTWYLELKTSNTNWRAVGVENKIRPITKNINSIIKDIHKTRQKSQSARGLVAFVLFPIPIRIWSDEREKLLQHLHRIETQGLLLADSLVDNASFVEVTPAYGVLVFVVETT